MVDNLLPAAGPALAGPGESAGAPHGAARCGLRPVAVDDRFAAAAGLLFRRPLAAPAWPGWAGRWPLLGRYTALASVAGRRPEAVSEKERNVSDSGEVSFLVSVILARHSMLSTHLLCFAVVPRFSWLDWTVGLYILRFRLLSDD